MVKNEPIIAKIGSKNAWRICGKKLLINFPNIIEIIAPTAAPLDTPIKPGSTSGFLNKPCKIAPDVPSPAPTNIARTTLGKRIFIKTDSWIFEKNSFSMLCKKPNWLNKI